MKTREFLKLESAKAMSSAIAGMKKKEVEKQQAFLYLFDYGDNLVHRVKVIDITETNT